MRSNTSPFITFLVVALLSVAAALIQATSGSIDLSIQLSVQNTSTLSSSSSNSPRRAVVDFGIKFSGEIDGNTPTIETLSIPSSGGNSTGLSPLTFSSSSTNAKYFSESFDASTRTLSVTIKTSVQSITKTQLEVYYALSASPLSITISNTGSNTKVKSVSSPKLFFEELSLVHVDAASSPSARTFSEASSLCSAAGGFLATSLKTHEDVKIQNWIKQEVMMKDNSSSFSSLKFWLGNSMTDQRPMTSKVCWESDPDYDASQCHTSQSGYFGFYSVFGTNPTCRRISPYSCPSLVSVDYDSQACCGKKFSVVLFTNDNGTSWVTEDRYQLSTSTGYVCTNLTVSGSFLAMDVTNLNGYSTTKTLPKTASKSLEETESRVLTPSKEVSHTETLETSSSQSETLQSTESEQYSESKTLELSESKSISKAVVPTTTTTTTTSTISSTTTSTSTSSSTSTSTTSTTEAESIITTPSSSTTTTTGTSTSSTTSSTTTTTIPGNNLIYNETEKFNGTSSIVIEDRWMKPLTYLMLLLQVSSSFFPPFGLMTQVTSSAALLLQSSSCSSVDEGNSSSSLQQQHATINEIQFNNHPMSVVLSPFGFFGQQKAGYLLVNRIGTLLVVLVCGNIFLILASYCGASIPLPNTLYLWNLLFVVPLSFHAGGMMNGSDLSDRSYVGLAVFAVILVLVILVVIQYFTIKILSSHHFSDENNNNINHQNNKKPNGIIQNVLSPFRLNMPASPNPSLSSPNKLGRSIQEIEQVYSPPKSGQKKGKKEKNSDCDDDDEQDQEDENNSNNFSPIADHEETINEMLSTPRRRRFRRRSSDSVVMDETSNHLRQLASVSASPSVRNQSPATKTPNHQSEKIFFHNFDDQVFYCHGYWTTRESETSFSNNLFFDSFLPRFARQFAIFYPFTTSLIAFLCGHSMFASNSCEDSTSTSSSKIAAAVFCILCALLIALFRPHRRCFLSLCFPILFSISAGLLLFSSSSSQTESEITTHAIGILLVIFFVIYLVLVYLEGKKISDEVENETSNKQDDDQQRHEQHSPKMVLTPTHQLPEHDHDQAIVVENATTHNPLQRAFDDQPEEEIPQVQEEDDEDGNINEETQNDHHVNHHNPRSTMSSSASQTQQEQQEQQEQLVRSASFFATLPQRSPSSLSWTQRSSLNNTNSAAANATPSSYWNPQNIISSASFFNNDNNSLEEYIKELQGRKFDLQIRLLSWYRTFVARHHQEPTIGNMENDSKIAPVYHEYDLLRKKLKKLLSSKEETDTKEQKQNEEQNLSEEAKRRKELKSKINSWKSEFLAVRGRQPLQGDIFKDDEANEWYREYRELKKKMDVQPPSTPKQEKRQNDDDEKERSTHHQENNKPHQQQPETSSPAFSPRTRSNLSLKASLRKRLHDWANDQVAKFPQKYKTRPSHVPIELDYFLDPEIGGVYCQYQELRTMIRERRSKLKKQIMMAKTDNNDNNEDKTQTEEFQANLSEADNLISGVFFGGVLSSSEAVSSSSDVENNYSSSLFGGRNSNIPNSVTSVFVKDGSEDQDEKEEDEFVLIKASPTKRKLLEGQNDEENSNDITGIDDSDYLSPFVLERKSRRVPEEFLSSWDLRRRRALGREINRWKMEFIERHRRQHTNNDNINDDDDDEEFSLSRQYTALSSPARRKVQNDDDDNEEDDFEPTVDDMNDRMKKMYEEYLRLSGVES